MNWEITWADMCRACMAVEGILLPLYDDNNEMNVTDLSSKLAELASIEINKSDGLPTKLCAKCVYKTKEFFQFKYLVQETDKKLRYMFSEQVVSNVEDDQTSVQMNDQTNGQIDDQTNGRMNNQTNDEKGDQKADQMYNNYIIPEIHLKDCEIAKEENNSYNNTNEDDTVVLQSKNEKVNGTSAVEGDFQDVCDSVILKMNEKLHELSNDNGEITNLHVVFHSDDFDAINNINESHFIGIESNNGIQETVVVSFKAAESENKEGLDVTNSLPTSSQIFNNPVEENEIFENSNLNNTPPYHNDSNSDDCLETRENIVGSLNDTITKVKEIKEAGKIVQYQCTLCLQNYKVLSEALTHIVDLHVPSSGPYYCVVCEMDCDSMKHLKAHVKTHKGRNPYTCFLCNKSYVMKRYLKRHMACHTDFPRHRCAKCGVRFKVKSELESHISSHSQEAPFKCSQCPRVFNHKGNYKRHLIFHLDPKGLHLPKYPCTICNKRFLNNRTLNTHMRVHTGEKPYKCEVCNKTFSQQGNLLNHQRIHSNPRNFVCEVCGKSFNQKATLRDHSLLHSGEKPYVCKVCGTAFTFSAALRRHAWTHSEGKPFECDVCNAKFIGRYDLKRHMKIHSGRPKLKRTKPSKTKEKNATKIPEEIINIVQDQPDSNTIFVEQIFLYNDSIQIIAHEDSEKENVNSLLGLIQDA